MIKKRYSFFILIIFLAFSVTAKESENWTDHKVKIVHEGNFALPLSQQPAPLFSFGQNLVDKNDFLVFVYPSQIKGPQNNFVEVVPSLLYGLTDTLSLFIELPIATKITYQNEKSHGLGDLIVQLEQVVYAAETPRSVNEITAVGHITFPTGSASKEPPTGLGSPSFFLGVTLSRTKPDWYYFCSFGGEITTFHKRTKFGNTFLYQFGVGRNIAYKSDKWILNWMVELDGIYKQRDNTVFMGPSIFFSTQHFEIDGGVSAVIAQHLFGEQQRERFFMGMYAGWKF
jgi:hypothetical protein